MDSKKEALNLSERKLLNNMEI